MKLKTNLPARRDGSLPKIETGSQARRGTSESIGADADGVYEVDGALGARLLETGNFCPADGVAEPIAQEASQPTNDAGNVIVCDDGETVDLDDMKRADLEAFALENFDLKFKPSDNKGAIVAAIMAAVNEAPAE